MLRLIKMCLNESLWFEVRDGLSLLLFNFTSDYFIRKARENLNRLQMNEINQ
jgi:hypothetical protein